MELNIAMFKSSGKFYTDVNVKNDVDIPLYSDEFKTFIKNNLPSRLAKGYIIVKDNKENQSFHYVLYIIENGNWRCEVENR